jgi:hypothetical protein
MIEFTLVGIPMIFMLVSIFEISRAMWNYHTLAFAVREGTRYAVVHGSGCTSDPLNSCQVTVGQVAQRIQNAGIGLEPSQLNLTFTSSGHSIPCTLKTCVGIATVWPETPNNIPGARSQLARRSRFNRLWPCFGPARDVERAFRRSISPPVRRT